MGSISNKKLKNIKSQVSNTTEKVKDNEGLEDEIEQQLKKQSEYKRSITKLPKKQRTRFQKITIFASIIMVLLMIGPLVYTSFHSAGFF